MLTREQIAKAWAGIPETYWPSPDKPWRVSWGLGMFKDFVSEAEAIKFYEREKATQKNGWDALVREPFNVHERTLELA